MRVPHPHRLKSRLDVVKAVQFGDGSTPTLMEAKEFQKTQKSWIHEHINVRRLNMRRALLLALLVLLLAGSPATTVEGGDEACVAVERDGQIVFEPEGCNVQQGSPGGGG